MVNPLRSRKSSSPRSSVSTMTALVLSGMPGTGSASQLPGVTVCTRLTTSASVTMTSLSFVQA